MQQVGQSEDVYRLVLKEYASILKTVPDEKAQVLALSLIHKQSYFSSFSSSSFKRSWTSTKSELTSALEEAQSGAVVRQTELQLVTCLLNALAIERRMGYQEKAIGIVTALLETNVFTNNSLEQCQSQWDDNSKPKIGEVDEATGDLVSQLEQKVMDLIGLQGDKQQETLFTKECATIQDVCLKEQVYANLFWRPATSSQDRRRIGLDSYSVVLFEDIEDYLVQFSDSDIKCRLLDDVFDEMGLPRPFSVWPTQYSSSFQKMAGEALQRDNKRYEMYEACVLSPQLSQFAVLASTLLERDIQVCQVTRFEVGRNILTGLSSKYQKSKLLKLSQFVCEILRSKSPYFKSSFAQSGLDKTYKSTLKVGQDNPQLWMALIEVEAMTDPTNGFEKIKSLSAKVIASFEKHKHAPQALIILLELYCRLGVKSSSASKSAVLFEVLSTAYSLCYSRS